MSQDDDRRDALRDDLRAVDPARSLPPLTAAAVGRLLEETMSDDPTRPDPGSTRTPRRTALLAAAAAVVVAGVGGLAWAVLGPDGSDAGPSEQAVDSTPPPATTPTASATPGPSPSAGESLGPAPGSVTTLGIGQQGAARCMVPSAEVLAGQDLGVLATVSTVEEGTVLLDVDRWYAGPAEGPETDTVEVDAVEPVLRDLLLAPDLEAGEQYLLSATDGLITLCGFSGPVTPELEALYAEAFG